MSPHAPQAPLRPSERGSVLVQFALLAAVIVTLLGVVQIGYMYYAKRDLQRVADIAAIEAVNAITYNDFDTCPLGRIAGSRSVSTQLRASIDLNTPDPQCGHWDGSKADAMRFDEDRVGTFNAMRVQLQGEVLQLLPMVGSRVITATATAAKDSEPLAAFSIGSQLMRFNKNGLLGRITAAVGLDIERLTILDKDGIANAKITPAGLLKLIGLPIGVSDLSLLTPNDLANVNASVIDLLNAAINAGGSSLLNAGVDIAALIDLRAYLSAFQLANVKIPLGGDKGLLALISAGGNASPIGASLDVAVDLSDLVRTQLLLANGTNSVALGLGLPGVLGAKMTVVEPPSYAIGAATGKTKARSAQVRLSIDIGEQKNVTTPSLLSALLGGLLGIRVHIPIQVDLVRSTGTLEAIQCTPDKNQRTANISVRSAVGDVCIGELDANGVCQKTELVDLNLLNVLGGVRIQSKLSTSLLQGATYSSAPNAQACPHNNSSVDECLVGMQVGVEKPSGPNGLHLGTTVADLLKQVPPLVGDVKNAEFYGVLGGVLGVLLNALLGGVSTLLNVIVTVVTALLAPLLNTIGGVLDLLLQGLGIELGRATVEVLKIQCDTAQIVQ
ncbi:TadE/TadG family type IV pilus assembly protein [Comamonas sp. JUb58]|uniref:TadE/TadG family type IV pilus assembly protein n=1 Tax=Comamonas sp. JUb58 TaxID=2485114 RepID=UPI0010E1C468|nr:TadE/TadG family type IV pilus assembly protein [Comamonas sp. JUb58]TDS73186.1 putative membrane protein [Comamonas sp. JUb58]